MSQNQQQDQQAQVPQYDMVGFQSAFNLVMNSGLTPVMPLAVYERLTTATDLTPTERHILTLVEAPPGQTGEPVGTVYGVTMFFREPLEGDVSLF